jgi:hypothetical protein
MPPRRLVSINDSFDEREKSMGSDPNPVSVYPEPGGGGGGARNNAFTPVNTAMQMTSIVLGAGSVAAAAAGSGTSPDTNFLFQYAAGRGLGFMGFHAASATYVAIAVVLGALSVLLSVINLVNGMRMKERLRELGQRVCDASEKAGVFDWYRKQGNPGA